MLDFDEACTRTAEEWLAEGMPEPWVLYVPLVFPHPPFTVEEPWFSRHERGAMTAPLSPADERGEKPRYMHWATYDRIYREISDMEMDAIYAATMGAADLLSYSDRIGSIETGKLADIIATDGDPLEDITELERVTTVIKSGRVIR